ncbi:hypothetical protein ACWDE9_34205, partial [Streptomyces olivaceoviridis]
MPDRGAGAVLLGAIGLLPAALRMVYGRRLLVVAVPPLMLSVALAVHGTTAREKVRCHGARGARGVRVRRRRPGRPSSSPRWS